LSSGKQPGQKRINQQKKQTITSNHYLHLSALKMLKEPVPSELSKLFLLAIESVEIGGE
jgi:hypothetical protein